MNVNDGTGPDRMGGEEDGLKLDWQWLMQCELSMMPPDDQRRLPCQTCFATTPTVGEDRWGFRLSAIDWHSDYEACVELIGDTFARKRGYATRLQAQLAAEHMVGEVVRKTLDVCRKMGL